MRELASRGFWMTNVAPMGYEFEWVEHGGKMRRHLAINPEEQPAIRALWDEAIALNTLLTIARNLTKQGFLTREGKLWTGAKVHRALKNEAYAGTVILGLKSVEGQGKCPAKCSAKMSLDHVAMVSDVSEMGTVRDRRLGGPPASRYLLVVDLWIPNSRSIARSDMPLRLAFCTAFHLSF